MTEPQGWPEDATYDALIGRWSIYQREKGHKTSTDDVLTAWLGYHCMAGRSSRRYLDLGCGIGSVLLMTCHALQPGYALGIEAQQQSAAMAAATIARLPDAGEIDLKQGDFRELDVAGVHHSFDLVTGSPPYFPVGTGTMSADYQRSACRFELRGGVEAYCEAAERAMTPEARFVLVFQTQWDERVLQAAGAVSLELQQRVDVKMRVDNDQPFLSVYEFARTPTELQVQSFAVRDEEGAITPEYRAIRTELGLSTSR
jgi:tRNA1Val (adenine37-N6)-methyltransferase